MAEKKLDIKISATGAAQTQGALDRIGQSLKGLKKSGQAEGLEQIGNLLRGGGALAGGTAIFNKIAEAAEAYKALRIEAEKTGEATVRWGDALEAAIKSIPFLGQGYRIGESLFDDSAVDAARAARQKEILDRLGKAFDQSKESERLIGLRGDDLEAEQARIKRDKALEQIARDAGQLDKIKDVDEGVLSSAIRLMEKRKDIVISQFNDDIAKIGEKKKKSPSSSNLSLPASLDSRFLSGLAAQGKDEIELRRIAKNGEETNKKLERLVKAVERSAGSSGQKLLVAPSFR